MRDINITDVFCAEMRVGHACICPRTDTWLAGFEVIPPQKQLAFPRPKNANSGAKLLFLSGFKSTNSGQNKTNRTFSRKLCHADLDYREEQAILL